MTESLREALKALSVLVGKSPAGHKVAYQRWLDLGTEASKHVGAEFTMRPVDTEQGRRGFLALAEDALDRDDLNDLMSVCVAAATWEMTWMVR
jgi:hypothetical protein